MPTSIVNTNIPLEKIPDNFEAEMVETLHKEFFYPRKVMKVKIP